MIDVTVTFVLWNLPTLLIPPDSMNDKWGKFAHPAEDDKGLFHFKDADGDIKLVINHESSVTITVGGTISEEVLKHPNQQDSNHQLAVASFYVRAFTLLNHLLLRYRFNTFNYRTHPIKWRFRPAPTKANVPLPSEFILETPIESKIDWVYRRGRQY